jgi:hypothetical protein
MQVIGSRDYRYLNSGPQGSKTKMSILEFVSISPGTALEIKYKYLVGPDKKRKKSDGKTCADVLNTIADGKGGRHTCGARIKWHAVMNGKTDDEAKALVGSEFPTECGACALATCSKNGPVFHVSIGATRIGAQQGPLIDYPTSKCRNHKGSVANGCRTCWSPEQTLLIEVNTQVSGRLDLHINNNARYLLLQPASVITLGTPPPWSKVNFTLFQSPPHT